MADAAGLLRGAGARFREAGLDTPDLDARLLLAECLGLEPGILAANAHVLVPDEAQARFAQWVDRRLAREPVYRIVGRRPFYEHDFLLSPGTLEPRSDTEILVDAARRELDTVLRRRRAARFCDIGTGTGAIAVSLLALFPAATGIAVDISDDALATAGENARRAGVADRLALRRSDYLAGVDGPLELVLSNPPYIPSSQIASLAPEVRGHDPRLALDGGPDGLDAYRAIAAQAPHVLTEDGALLLEIGAGQGPDVRAIVCDGHRFVFEGATRDLRGIERVLRFRRVSRA